MEAEVVFGASDDVNFAAYLRRKPRGVFRQHSRDVVVVYPVTGDLAIDGKVDY
jgi:hypothetical protein